MILAARKHKRYVQMGNQRRSYPLVMEAMQRLNEGIIGKTLSARTFYNSSRGSIGKGKMTSIPEHLDYKMWQGPAPELPYKDNLIPYNWHWHWHYGGGEITNNGVHALDLARWGLGVGLPKRVTYGGSRYHFKDDQETPDTGMATFDFGKCGAMWDQSSCDPRKGENTPFVAFYGEGGSLTCSTKNDYSLYDLNGKKIESKNLPPNQTLHFNNFVNAIRHDEKLNSEIADAQASTLLCHLANMAWRTNSTVNFESKKRRIINNSAAAKLWGRQYRKGWEPKV